MSFEKILAEISGPFSHMDGYCNICPLREEPNPDSYQPVFSDLHTYFLSLLIIRSLRNRKSCYSAHQEK